MLQFNFNRLFKARGIDRPFTYLKKAGFSPSYASNLKNKKIKRVDLKYLEKLCLMLRCTPNDVIEWIPDNENEVSADHPLNEIRKNDMIVDITRTLNTVPIDRLEEINKLINDTIRDNG